MTTTNNAPASAPSSTPATETNTSAAKPAGSKSAELAAKLNALTPKPTGSTPTAEPGDTGPEAPAPTARDATKLAQALNKLSATERQSLEHKSAAEKSGARVKELETQLATFEEARKDINKLLQYGKVTPEALAMAFREGKLKFQPEPDSPPAPDLPDDVKREIEYARGKREQEERDAAERQAIDARTSDIKTITEALEPLASKYPLTSALPKAADHILDALIAHAEMTRTKENPDGEQLDLETALQRAEKAVGDELKAIAGNEAALKVLLADDETKSKVIALLGLQTSSRAPKNPPAMTARNTSEVPAAKKGWDPAAAAARLKAMNGD